jgi:hypothetical protein
MTRTTKTRAGASRRPLRKTDRNTPKRRPGKPALASVGAPAAAISGSALAPIRSSKKASLLALLERPDGAAISELTEATGWQVHSVRAALTGFRNDGMELIRAKDEAGVTRYRLAVEA